MMSFALLIFFSSACISFMGSIQPGPVNLYVINSVLKNKNKAALWIAFGGCLPEFIFCAFALHFNTFLLKNEYIQNYFKWIFIFILLIISVLLFFKKNATYELENKEIEDKKSIAYLAKGFALAAVNPQLLPFWVLVSSHFNLIDFLSIQSKTQQISFITGAGVGAFALLSLLVIVVKKHKEVILKRINHRYYNKILSIICFIIAMQQLI